MMNLISKICFHAPCLRLFLIFVLLTIGSAGNVIADISITKSFSGPGFPGGTVDLEFRVSNNIVVDPLWGIYDYCGIYFTDDLDAFLSGITAVNLPQSGICGPNSQIEMLPGTNTIYFEAHHFPLIGSWVIRVPITIPTGTPLGTYTNTTSGINGSLDCESPHFGLPASADLIVGPIFNKRFSPNPVPIGGSTTLTFTLENPDPSITLTNISFTDDLSAVLPGLSATGLPLNDICGAGSQLTGTNLITFTGGSLAPGASCSFDIPLQVPSTALPGTYTNTATSSFTGDDMEMFTIAASADLSIEPLPTFSKFFTPDTISVRDISTLSFTIDNSASAIAVTALNFTDNLPSGIVIANSPNDFVTCPGGTLTAVAGTSVISYTGGSVDAGSACIISVDVTGTTPGTFINTTHDLTSSSGNSGTASDALTIIPLPVPIPTLSKFFTPDTISVRDISTLSFTIDNSASAIAVTALNFTDNLPSGIVIANSPNDFVTCPGGTLTAVAGTSVISYAGGSVDAGSACTISVDVTGTTPGTFINTTHDLTSSSGNSGTASDALTIIPLPVPIPTLSEWGKIIFMVLLGLSGILYFRKSGNGITKTSYQL